MSQNFANFAHLISMQLNKQKNYQARRKQLESGAAKTKEILKTPQQKGFYFFISKNLT